jgi:hypothetical protein
MSLTLISPSRIARQRLETTSSRMKRGRPLGRAAIARR